jgi:SAM-dependent methyltransferase
VGSGALTKRATGMAKWGLRALPGDLDVTLPPRLRRLRRPAWHGATHGRPVSEWGWERGGPVDRYYVDAFLSAHRQDVTGRVLEVRDRRYTERWGSAVSVSDVVDVDPDLPGVTWVADLTTGDPIPDGRYDCFLLTQTLQFVYDVPAVLRTAHRVLAPAGTLLATLPVTSRLSLSSGSEVDFWRFTPASGRRLFGEVFGPGNVEVTSSGNLRATIAFLRGMSHQEIPATALDEPDDRSPLLVCVRARKI